MGKWRNFYRNDRSRIGSCGWGFVELEESLAETNKSRTGKCENEKPICSGPRRAVNSANGNVFILFNKRAGVFYRVKKADKTRPASLLNGFKCENL